MTKADLQKLTTEELVKRFTDIALKQYTAVMGDDVKTFNKLFAQMNAVDSELKSRPGDARRALTVLYDHPNPEVRLRAAKRTLAVDYTAARRVLEHLAGMQPWPQAGDAGMALVALDRGIFKPT